MPCTQEIIDPPHLASTAVTPKLALVAVPQASEPRYLRWLRRPQ